MGYIDKSYELYLLINKKIRNWKERIDCVNIELEDYHLDKIAEEMEAFLGEE